MKTSEKGTKFIKLHCKRCGASHIFLGESVQELMNDIDSHHWIDAPDGDLCPACFKIALTEEEVIV